MPELSLPQLDCRACGACCSDVGVPPYAAWETFGLPRRLRRWFHLVMAALEGDPRGGPCVALRAGTTLCRIYRWRPALCRDLPVGGSLCSTYRKRKELA